MARKKHQRVMTLGGMRFETKKAAHEWIKGKKAEYIQAEQYWVMPHAVMFRVLEDVFRRHPEDLARKQIRAFEFAQHDEQAWGERGIIIHYWDETAHRFPKLERGLVPDWDIEHGTDGIQQGWRDAKAEARRKANQVLRWEIEPDIRDFRACQSVCEECGLPVLDRPHVDHAGPSFVDLRDSWLELQGRVLHELDLETCPYSRDGAQWLADRALADSWVMYHMQHMVLEYLHENCHVKRTAERRQCA